MDRMDVNNKVTVEIYNFDENGSIIPNTLFHRPLDYLHSRCIEYPFAASQLGTARKILDIGTTKSDKVWIAWLESLPIEVHATDYDKPFTPFRKIEFHRGDIRNLPIDSEVFDKILAVSVIEHIGLRDPQVINENRPLVAADGDIKAFKEILRMLKQGGEVVMTLPFGCYDEIVLGSARNYTTSTIEKFNSLAEPLILDYYEYQYSNFKALFKNERVKLTKIDKISKFFKKHKDKPGSVIPTRMPELAGSVTWRRLPMADAMATHYSHIEGVLCGVWRKQ